MKKGSALILFTLLTIPTLHASEIRGAWNNETENSHGIQKIVISPNNHTIRLFRHCRWNSGLCSAGEHSYMKTRQGFLSSWLGKNNYKVILAEKINSKRLKVIIKRLPYYGAKIHTKIVYFNRAKDQQNIQAVRAFLGDWVPIGYQSSKDVKKVRISQHNNKIKVRTKGRCHSGICEWESSNVHFRNGHLTLSWYQPGIERKADIKGVHRNQYGLYDRLKVKVRSYLDNGIQLKKVMYLRRVNYNRYGNRSNLF